MSTETPGEPLPDWERDLIALDAQRQEQFNAWIDKQGYVDPLGQLAEAFEGGWADAAAHAASSGYQGPAQHTYTDACDGFHEPGQDCNLPAEGSGEPPADAGPLLREIILDMARAIRASMNGSGRIARSEVIDWTARAEVEFDIYAEPGSDQ
jgi:hypothetical protein